MRVRLLGPVELWIGDGVLDAGPAPGVEIPLDEDERAARYRTAGSGGADGIRGDPPASIMSRCERARR